MKRQGFTAIEFIVVIAIIVLTMGLMISPAFLWTGIYHLATGWFFYLSSTLPNVEIRWTGIVTFLIALLALGLLTHSFLKWLAKHRHVEGEAVAWRWQWTVKTLAIILLAFAAGICATGMVHQIGWLASSKEPIIQGGLRDAAYKMLSGSNLRQIMIAMHNYHSDYGTLPPVFSVAKDAEKRPLLSWRVLLLPYVEEDALFKKFKLDEPWDSPHNTAVLQQNPMPRIYVHPNKRDGDTKMTYYRAFYSKLGVGKSAGLTTGTITLKTISDEDGASNTAALIEGDSVYWTKPDDIEYDEQKPLPAFTPHWRGKLAQVAMFDGSIRSIRVDVPESALKALITRNGREVIDFSVLE